MKGRNLILVELNEVNFDVVAEYLEANPGALPALRKLVSGARIRTTAEKLYENLEPWIQWPSVHCGLSFEEHGVFRLGDMVSSSAPQIFELLEDRGLRIGVVSAMNAVNRLKTPAYFIPDPWTVTPTDGTWWSRVLGSAVSQAVNDNSQASITVKSLFFLILGFVRFARVRNYFAYLKLALSSRGRPWRRAIFLDYFLHDLHLTLYKLKRPDFSVLFLNAGAHIQHHYFFNSAPVRRRTSLRNPTWYVGSDADPVAEMLAAYDLILADYLGLANTELIVATGLSQKPYDRAKFYYRLRDHESVLRLLKVEFATVAPRMTRDFLVECSGDDSARLAEAKLKAVVIAGSDEPLFGDIDNRGSSLFVTLTYPHEISASTNIELDGVRHKLLPLVAFVAVKNGMHQEDGFAFFTPGTAEYAPVDLAHVKALYGTIVQFFGGLVAHADSARQA